MRDGEIVEGFVRRTSSEVTPEPDFAFRGTVVVHTKNDTLRYLDVLQVSRVMPA